MKKILAIILPIVLITAAVYGYFTITAGTVMAYVSVDINPSVQFVTDGEEVIGVTASNEDGEIILLGVTDELIGMNIEEATQKVVELAIEYGYLDPEALETDPNAITITTMLETQNERLENKLREKVRVHLEGFFKNNGIFGLVMTDLDMTDIIAEAETLGISAGNLKLIRSVQAVYPELTDEDALELPVKDLMDMLRDVREITNFIDYLEDQVTLAQTTLNQITASLTTANENLLLAQATLDEYELIDTSLYTEEELTAYNAQLLIYQTAVSTLETQITTLTAELNVAQTTLTNLETALLDRETHMTELQNQVQTRKGQALAKYEDWLLHKEERAEQVKNRWEEFKNGITDEELNGIIDSIQNAWGNND